MTANPILVEVSRGGEVESVHRGRACVVDASGKVVRAWGDIESHICPRSSTKPFQALPLVTTGAADAFLLGAEELALACASHSGEHEHTSRVAAWLSRLDLSVDDLACGAHAPSSTSAYEALIRGGGTPSRIHNNCSGKHTSFLTVARHLGVATRGYHHVDHPVQQLVLECLGEMSGCDPKAFHTVCDGCSAPNVFMPLHALALAWARLGTSQEPAPRRIVDAMKAHPVLMSGHGRSCETLINAMTGRGVVKTGAEGVFAATIPEQGLGIAVKIDDGAGRAATIAMTAILESLRAFKPAAAGVAALKGPVITSWAGEPAGAMRAAFI